MGIRHPLQKPGILGHLREAPNPAGMQPRGIRLHGLSCVALGRGGDQGVAQVKQFRQGSLGRRELSQAGGDWTFGCFLRVVFGIAHHGQVSEIEWPQISFEDFGTQWDQPVEDLIDVPQFILVARLMIRTDGQDAALALFVLEKL
jgi:hypothetical protein